MVNNWGERSNRRQPVPARIRAYVLKRDGYRCQIVWDQRCMWTATECDHIEVRSGGGADDPSNLRASCAPCNAARNIATRPHRRTAKRKAEPPPGLIT